MFYSATMSSEIERLVHQFMRDPAIVRIAPKVMTAASITQKFYAVEPTQKTSLLATLLAEHAFESAIIFCNRKRDIPLVCRGLGRAGYRAEALHGDMSQEQRSRTLRAFKAGQIDLLVASDVAARGLDVDDLPVVVNYDVPKSSEDYIHRIGRTGRAGKTGMSITMVTGSDEKQIRALRKHLQKDIVVERINGMTLVEIDVSADRGGGSSSRSYSSSRNGGRNGDEANRSYRSQEGGAGRSGGFGDRGSRSSYGSRRRSGEDAGSSYPAASAAPGGNSPHGDRNPNGASTPGSASRRRPSAGFSARGDVSNDNSSRGRGERGERGEFKARSSSSAGSRRHADDNQSHDFPGFLKKRPG
jgi:superfamily II DNA/RNA helicase